MSRLVCSAEGCAKEAVETLFLGGRVGHVHDCSQHAAQLREWCDVVASYELVDGECMAVACTGDEWIWFGAPPALGGDPS